MKVAQKFRSFTVSQARRLQKSFPKSGNWAPKWQPHMSGAVRLDPFAYQKRPGLPVEGSRGESFLLGGDTEDKGFQRTTMSKVACVT